jgi:hypothetical protein
METECNPITRILDRECDYTFSKVSILNKKRFSVGKI